MMRDARSANTTLKREYTKGDRNIKGERGRNASNKNKSNKMRKENKLFRRLLKGSLMKLPDQTKKMKRRTRMRKVSKKMMRTSKRDITRD